MPPPAPEVRLRPRIRRMRRSASATAPPANTHNFDTAPRQRAAPAWPAPLPVDSRGCPAVSLPAAATAPETLSRQAPAAESSAAGTGAPARPRHTAPVEAVCHCAAAAAPVRKRLLRPCYDRKMRTDDSDVASAPIPERRPSPPSARTEFPGFALPVRAAAPDKGTRPARALMTMLRK